MSSRILTWAGIITNVRRTSLPISIMAVPRTGQFSSFPGMRCSTTSTGTLSGRRSSSQEERLVWAATRVSINPSALLPAALRTPHRVSSCSGEPVSEASPVSGSVRLFPLSETHIPPVK